MKKTKHRMHSKHILYHNTEFRIISEPHTVGSSHPNNKINSGIETKTHKISTIADAHKSSNIYKYTRMKYEIPAAMDSLIVSINRMILFRVDTSLLLLLLLLLMLQKRINFEAAHTYTVRFCSHSMKFIFQSETSQPLLECTTTTINPNHRK